MKIPPHLPSRFLFLSACLLPLAVSAQSEPATPLQIEPQDILSTKVVQTGQRSITLQKLDPARMEAKIPAAFLQAESTSQVFTGEPEPLTEEPADPRPSRALMLAVSVHLADESHPENAITLLEFPPADGQPPVSFWINANFLWMTNVTEVEGETERLNLIMATSRGTGPLPADLAFPESATASYRIAGGTPTAAQLATIQALLDYYNDPAQRTRLRNAYTANQQAAALQAAERAANPPEKKNLIIRYWRSDATSRQAQQNGGAR